MSTKFTYQPKGVCSRQMDFEMEGNVIESLKVTGGCNGNLNGISSLVKGHTAEEIISLLEGTKCGIKNTSCPDQIADAMKAYLKQAQ